MTDLQKFQRACRVFLARLLMVHGEDAPAVLRRMADELEWLAAQERVECNCGGYYTGQAEGQGDQRVCDAASSFCRMRQRR